MNVLALTILVSSCLAGIFICCFAAEYRRCRNKSLGRDSLLPLNDLLTLRGAWDKLRTDPVLMFFAAAVTFYGMATFEGPLLSIRAVNALSHYTDWTVGHMHSSALGYNLTAVGICLFGHMSPLLAAVLMPLSSAISLAIVAVGLRWRNDADGKVDLAANSLYGGGSGPSLPDTAHDPSTDRLRPRSV